MFHLDNADCNTNQYIEETFFDVLIEVFKGGRWLRDSMPSLLLKFVKSKCGQTAYILRCIFIAIHFTAMETENSVPFIFFSSHFYNVSFMKGKFLF